MSSNKWSGYKFVSITCLLRWAVSALPLTALSSQCVDCCPQPFQFAVLHLRGSAQLLQSGGHWRQRLFKSRYHMCLQSNDKQINPLFSDIFLCFYFYSINKRFLLRGLKKNKFLLLLQKRENFFYVYLNQMNERKKWINATFECNFENVEQKKGSNTLKLGHYGSIWKKFVNIYCIYSLIYRIF